MTLNSAPPVAVVCSTYRNPEHDNAGRLMGLTGIITQFLSQDYPGRVSLAILDTSPTPHPFAQIAAEAYSDRFIYLHVPERNNINPLYKKLYPEAMSRIPDDEALKSPYWQFQAEKTKGWARFVPIEDDFPRPVDVGSHINQARPTIGMKKNAGVLAICEAFGEPAQIIFTDDDDYHGPSYVSDLVKGRGDAGFTRINRYLVNIDNPKIANNQIWGMYDFAFPQDANGTFYVTEQMKSEPILTSEVLDDGSIREVDPRTWFKRAMVLAWSPCSHEGAIHSYGFDMWKKGYDAFGASPACSFGEDVILFKMMKDYFGREFQGVLTDIPLDPEKMNFLRTSDGTNASYLMYNRHMPENAVIPEWALSSMNNFRAVAKSGLDPRQLSAELGRVYAETGCYDPVGHVAKNTGRNIQSSLRTDYQGFTP